MIGISTLCSVDSPLPDVLAWIEKHSQSAEILDGGLHSLTERNVEILGGYSLRYSIHAPVADVNIASVYEQTRVASIEILKERFEIAADINASIVIHPGHVSWENDRPLAQQQLLKSIRDLLNLKEETGVPFFIENLLNWHSSLLKTPADLKLIGDALLVLDIGHAHTCGCLPEFLQRRYPHYHIHDNQGTDDQHMALGKGNIPIESLVSLLQDRKSTKIIEVNTMKEAEQTLSVFKQVGAT